MTFADQLFHNIYLLQEIFSHARIAYEKIENGDLIAEKGLLKLLQLKTEHGDVLHFQRPIWYAAGNGDLEIVRWLQENGVVSKDDYALGWAARGGHLETVQWLYANPSELYPRQCTVCAMQTAVACGQLQTGRWLYAQSLHNSDDHYHFMLETTIKLLQSS